MVVEVHMVLRERLCRSSYLFLNQAVLLRLDFELPGMHEKDHQRQAILWGSPPGSCTQFEQAGDLLCLSTQIFPPPLRTSIVGLHWGKPQKRLAGFVAIHLDHFTVLVQSLVAVAAMKCAPLSSHHSLSLGDLHALSVPFDKPHAMWPP